MVLEYGGGVIALMPDLDAVSRGAILDDCIDLHLEDLRAAERLRMQAQLRERMSRFAGRS